jgi:DnaD/phage-associated family protein
MPVPAPDDALHHPSVPAALLERLLRDVWDPLEVKVVLAVALLGGAATPVPEHDVLAFEALQHGSRGDGSQRAERLPEAVEIAAARGVLLKLASERGERWLLLGTHENRVRARGGVQLEGPSGATPILRPERPNIFGLYEQNIGLVTPIIADRLVDALEHFPEAWISEAIGEAVSYNRRNWRYIQRILENWATEGRQDETNRGTATRTLDREKHLHGKYASVFRRDE